MWINCNRFSAELYLKDTCKFVLSFKKHLKWSATDMLERNNSGSKMKEVSKERAKLLVTLTRKCKYPTIQMLMFCIAALELYLEKCCLASRHFAEYFSLEELVSGSKWGGEGKRLGRN